MTEETFEIIKVEGNGSIEHSISFLLSVTAFPTNRGVLTLENANELRVKKHSTMAFQSYSNLHLCFK